MSFLPRGYETYDVLSGPQQQIYNTLLENLQGQLGGKGLEQLRAPIMREFQEQIIPGLAERFSGAGAGGQSSSAFQQALGASGASLAERLGALGIGQQQSALSGLQNLLQVPTKGLFQKSRPWWQELLIGSAEKGGEGISKLLPLLLGLI